MWFKAGQIVGKIGRFLFTKPNMRNPVVKAASEAAAANRTRVFSFGRTGLTAAGAAVVGSTIADNETVQDAISGKNDKGKDKFDFGAFLSENTGIGSLVFGIGGALAGLVTGNPLIALALGGLGAMVGQPIMNAVASRSTNQSDIAANPAPTAGSTATQDSGFSDLGELSPNATPTRAVAQGATRTNENTQQIG